MVWSIITWETSTMVPLSSASQGNIFHRHVRLDIWRWRSTRIHVRLHTPHRKTTNSNDNQVCRAFCRTQWEHILFVCYEGSGVYLAPNIPHGHEQLFPQLVVPICSCVCCVSTLRCSTNARMQSHLSLQNTSSWWTMPSYQTKIFLLNSWCLPCTSWIRDVFHVRFTIHLVKVQTHV